MPSLKEIATIANNIEDELQLNLDAVLHKLTQEIGEFNNAIQKYRGIYCKEKQNDLSEIYSEWGDVIFNLISILNRLWIDIEKIEDMGNNTLKKFIERKSIYKKDL